MQMISMPILRHAYEPWTACLVQRQKYSDLATWQVGTGSLPFASWDDTCTWHHRWRMSMCLAVSILVLAHNQLQSNSQLHKEQIFRAWRHARLATILCVWDTHTWHHRQAPNGVTDEPIICPSEDAYVSAPRDTYGQRQVKDLQILTYTDKQHNHDSNIHTYRQSFIIPTDTARLL